MNRKEGVITRIVSNQYTVYIDGVFEQAIATGKLRLGDKPIVGDHVDMCYLEDKWTIQKVKPRRNQLIRPLVANVDQALIVMSAKEPDFSFTLVNRLIFLISLEGIKPVIVISKSDLVDAKTIKMISDEYVPFGYDFVLTGSDVATRDLSEVLNGKISVLAGQSGVGKSSLLNRLDTNLSLTTQEISKALGRGRHTTRHNQIYPISNGWIADTPGFSSLDFSGVDSVELSQSVPDFVPFIGKCKYRNCLHDKEPGCNVKEAILEGNVSKQRHNDYLECLKLIKEEIK